MKVDSIESLDNYRTERTVTNQEHWTIDDKNKATWAMRKMQKLLSDIEEVEGIATKEIEVVKSWEQERIGILKEQHDGLKDMLVTYLIIEASHDPSLKTIDLPVGKIARRSYGPDLRLTDEDKVLEYLRVIPEGPSYIKTTEKVKWADLKKTLKADGEVPAGVEMIPGGESYHVTLKKPKGGEKDDGQNLY